MFILLIILGFIMLDKEQTAFIEKHYKEMYNKLFLYAMRILKNSLLSEEAVQDTFRIACTKINIIYSSRNPEGWLVNTMRNVIRNIQKSQIILNKYIIHLSDIENVEDSTDFIKHDFELLFGDIAKSDDFKLLTRIVIDKITILEASKELGINVEACKKRVQRVKKKLKDKYEGK